MIWLFVVSVFIALFVSATCSLMEAALLSLTPGQIAEMSHKHPKIGARWQQFKNNIDRPISAILILNTAAHTVGATVAGAEFSTIFGARWIWIFSLCFTFVMLQYTEILPKTLGVRFNKSIAYMMMKPLSIMILLLTPVIVLVRIINLPFEPKPREDAEKREGSLNELILMTAIARQTHRIGKQQERIIVETMKLSKKTAQDVMIPMEDVSTIVSSMSIEEILTTEQLDSHTRYPVRESEHPDSIIGYINIKEVVPFVRENPKLSDLPEIIRDVHFIEPDESTTRLLLAFTSMREHLAVVKDDSGACLGIITLEDIMEEILGELEDEFDHLHKNVKRLNNEHWIVGAGISLGELYSTLLHTMPEGLERNETLSDWMDAQLPEPLELGQKVTLDDLVFQIRRITRKQISEVSIRLITKK